MGNPNLDFEPCLDDRNRVLFKVEIAPTYNIKFVKQHGNINLWGVIYRNGSNEVTIFAGNDYPNVECFTHEILHLFLFKNGFKPLSEENLIGYDNFGQSLVTPTQILKNIENQTAHYKMLPIYIDQLQYDKDLFFSKDNQPILQCNLDALENDFKIKLGKMKIPFTNFLTIYFDTRYHFSVEYEDQYSMFQSKLKEIDSELFSILTYHCEEWEKNITDYSNDCFVTSLFKALEGYCLKHQTDWHFW